MTYPVDSSRPVILKAPAVFDIENETNRSQVIEFLQRMRQLVFLDDQDVQISFVNTQRMVSNGTLLFTAELHRILELVRGRRKVTCSYPRNNKVEQVLQQIGLLKLLQKPERLTPSADDVIHWRFLDGTQAEGEKANRLIEVFAEKLPESLSKGLYNGLVEAMTNCVQHAYLEARGDETNAGRERGWWMFAQERDQRLMVAFCDLGIGIPRSLPKTHDPSVLRRVLERFGRAFSAAGYRDVDYIAAALEVGKTRTAEPHRGLGLKEFRQVVENSGDGYLRIFSNKACYNFYASADGQRETQKEFGDSIFGTLIQWSLPLKSKHGRDDRKTH